MAMVQEKIARSEGHTPNAHAREALISFQNEVSTEVSTPTREEVRARTKAELLTYQDGPGLPLISVGNPN